MARDFPSIQQAFMPEPMMRPAAAPASRPTDPASFYAMLAGQSRAGETAAAPPPSANLAVPPVAIAAVPAAAMGMAPSPATPGAAAAEPDWNHIDRRERGHLVATGHVNPATKGDNQYFGADGFTFDDFIDMINPLHHIPLIGSLYRWASGDTISPGSAIIGAGLLGGPIGLIAGAIGAAVTEANGGENMADAVVASVLGDGEPEATVMAAVTPEAAAAFEPAAGGIPLNNRPTEFRLPPAGAVGSGLSLFDGVATPRAAIPADDSAAIALRMADGLAKYGTMSGASTEVPPDPNVAVQLDEAAIEILLRQSM